MSDKMNTIDRPAIRTLSDEVLAALAPVAEKYGVEFKLGRATYSGEYGTLKVLAWLATNVESGLVYWRPARVSISGVLGPYQALVHRVNRWNGWAVPMFDRATVDRLVEDTRRLVEEEGEDAVVVVARDGDRVVLHDANYPDVDDVLDPVAFDGVEYWAVGAYSWTWEEEGATDGD